MAAFSRQESKKKAIKIKIRRAMIQVRKNPTYKLKHVAEARDAATGKYTLLVKRVTEETQAKQVLNERFRSKLHGIK